GPSTRQRCGSSGVSTGLSLGESRTLERRRWYESLVSAARPRGGAARGWSPGRCGCVWLDRRRGHEEDRDDHLVGLLRLGRQGHGRPALGLREVASGREDPADGDRISRLRDKYKQAIAT